MNRPCARAVQFFLALFLLSLAFTSLTWADDDDPPARVARMNFAQGQVSFQPGGEGDWVEAVPNRPLTTKDNLWTDRNSRAELHGFPRVAKRRGLAVRSAADLAAAAPEKFPAPVVR